LGPYPFKQVQELFLHHVQVQFRQVCTFFADHDIIKTWRHQVLIQPECFPDQAFDPVAKYCRTDFSARRDPQSPVIQAVSPDKDNKVFCLITPAIQVAGLELGPSGQPQVLGKI